MPRQTVGRECLSVVWVARLWRPHVPRAIAWLPRPQPERLNDLVDRYGDALLPIALDVVDFSAVEAAVDETVETFGRIDVVAE